MTMSAATLLLKIAKQFLGGTMVTMRTVTLLLKFHRNFRRDNGANEGNNSPPATQWIGGVPRRGEVVKLIHNA